MTAVFSAAEVAVVTGADGLSGDESIHFKGVSTDTRTLAPGALFIALTGENFDGHDFVQTAIKRGATGIIASKRIACDTPNVRVFAVGDTREALQALARFHRRRFQIPVIAVTGSNGKTSTKDMIAAVLGTAMPVLKTEANYNNEIGLSQTLLRLNHDHRAVVVEMGMRATGEIAGLSAVASPTMGLITNVGATHIERLGSIENIAAAKAELVQAIDVNGVAILNGDDFRVREMQRRTLARAVLYGLNSDCDVKAMQVEQQQGKVIFLCEAGAVSFRVSLPTPGVHNVYNALAAIAVGLELGVSPGDIARGLSEYEPGKMRLTIKKFDEITVIDDTYNASPLSMAAAIEVLASLAKGRKVAAIGDMLEMGEAGPDAHRLVGEQLVAADVAAVVTVGELASLAGVEARKHGVYAAPCIAHAAAIQALREILQPGDTLLLKGSRGMTMEKLLAVFAEE